MRQANAQRTQGCHSRRETLMASSSRVEVSGKLDAMFRATVNRVRTRFPKETEETNRETVSRVVFIFFQKFAETANVGKALLDENHDNLLDQARSEFMEQEHQVGSLNSCIDDLQQQSYAQRLELEDAHHGC